MPTSQLTRGARRRVMYLENKDGDIDGARARVGWVAFSKTGRTLYYRNLRLQRMKGGGVRGNYFEVESGDEFWVSGVKSRGSNAHPAEDHLSIEVDDDACETYHQLRARAAG